MTTKTMKKITIGLTSALLLCGIIQTNYPEEQPPETIPTLNVVAVEEQILPLLEVDFISEAPTESEVKVVDESVAAEENCEPIPTPESPIEQAPNPETVPEILPEVAAKPQATTESQHEPTPQPEPTIEPQPSTDSDAPPSTSALIPSEPAPSDDMIFLPGFGWVPKGEPAVTIEVHSTGDINKMVGIM